VTECLESLQFKYGETPGWLDTDNVVPTQGVNVRQVSLWEKKVLIVRGFTSTSAYHDQS